MTPTRICRTASCEGTARGALGFCPTCLQRYRALREAEHAARTTVASDLLEQIPLLPGMGRLHRKALAARAAVYALRAGAGPGAVLAPLWLDLAFIDLAEDFVRATGRVFDASTGSAQPNRRAADITSTALDRTDRS